jgi:hypothetical protein
LPGAGLACHEHGRLHCATRLNHLKRSMRLLRPMMFAQFAALFAGLE